MGITISTGTQIPIYEQIEQQIKDLILNGHYLPGNQLPSIRVLARELQVSIITCRRAYDDLCEEGILISQPGKGVYVANVKAELLRDKTKVELTDKLKQICKVARRAGLQKEEIVAMAEIAFEEVRIEETKTDEVKIVEVEEDQSEKSKLQEAQSEEAKFKEVEFKEVEFKEISREEQV